MKNWMKSIAFLALAAALSACGQQGKEYVGSWQAKEHANRTAAIERNGDNFVVKATEPSVFVRGLETTSIPAVYKDGMLEMSERLWHGEDKLPQGHRHFADADHGWVDGIPSS